MLNPWQLPSVHMMEAGSNCSEGLTTVVAGRLGDALLYTSDNHPNNGGSMHGGIKTSRVHLIAESVAQPVNKNTQQNLNIHLKVSVLLDTKYVLYVVYWALPRLSPPPPSCRQTAPADALRTRPTHTRTLPCCCHTVAWCAVTARGVLHPRTAPPPPHTRPLSGLLVGRVSNTHTRSRHVVTPPARHRVGRDRRRHQPARLTPHSTAGTAESRQGRTLCIARARRDVRTDGSLASPARTRSLVGRARWLNNPITTSTHTSSLEV